MLQIYMCEWWLTNGVKDILPQTNAYDHAPLLVQCHILHQEKLPENNMIEQEANERKIDLLDCRFYNIRHVTYGIRNRQSDILYQQYRVYW